MATSSNRLKISRPLAKILALFVFLTSGLVGISCQDPNRDGGNAVQHTPTPTPRPIKEPGQSGTKPTAATPVARRIIDTVDKYDPAAAPCDRVYQAQVEVTKLGVNCDTYNMTDLNNEAQKLVDAQLNKIQCPAGGPCTIRHSFYSFWSAVCKGTAATVKIKGYAICATDPNNPNSSDPGIPAPTDKAHPSTKATPAPVTIKAGENGNFNGIDDGDYIQTNIATPTSAGTTLACKTNTLFVFTYKEKDSQIPSIGVGDYGPVINRAVTRAGEMHSQYSCPSSCPKLTFVPLYVKWSASGEYVVVEVYFMVSCP